MASVVGSSNEEYDNRHCDTSEQDKKKKKNWSGCNTTIFCGGHFEAVLVPHALDCFIKREC